MQVNTDAAIASLLLGPAVAQQLCDCSKVAIEEQLSALAICSSLFLLRLRNLLKSCCENLGLETACSKLMLPIEIGYYIKMGTAMKTDIKKEEIAKTVLPVAKRRKAEEKTEGGEIVLTPDQRELVVTLYLKGIKLNYIAGLFGIVNPSAIHSWGDWRRLPQSEASKNLQRRKVIQDRLDHGESPMSIRLSLRIKERVYRDLMGQVIGLLFPFSSYETVMKQMAVVNFKKVVSRNTGVPIYFIRRWMEGLGIPDRPFLETDDDGTAEVKKQAISKFYETCNPVIAANSVGAATPQIVERWVAKYQKLVDEKLPEF